MKPIDTTTADAAPPALAMPDGRRPFVMLDGFNLSLEKGTGVATYGRNLSYAVHDLGCEVGVLYGHGFGADTDALLKEVSFFDPEAERLGRLHTAWRALRALTRSSVSQAFEVPMTGAVVADGFKARLPHHDSIWNARRLYDASAIRFHLTGRPSEVKFVRPPDLQHWTYPFSLRTAGVPNIYTLHDLVPLRLPFTTLDKKKTYLKLMRWIARTADHIVTVSEASRRDIIELLGVPPDRVTNTYQAVSLPQAYVQRSEEQVVREIEGIFGLKHQQYFLFFGSIEPKKNIGRMIEAYLASDSDTRLVIVGAQAWHAEKELRLVAGHERAMGQTMGPGRRIVQLEYVPLSLLVSLIRGARAVLFPSLYEGFGLPVLEAMLLGTPVLSSTTSSVPEVAGDAALLVDPYDTQAIAQAICALDGNDGLRADLAHRGRIQAAVFSEVAYKKKLGAVYVEVLSRHDAKSVSA
jgi:glycosyltransferase involved in cell wall biosynthesis